MPFNIPFEKFKSLLGNFNAGDIGGRPEGRPVGVANGMGTQPPPGFSNPALAGQARAGGGIRPMPSSPPVSPDGGIRPPWENRQINAPGGGAAPPPPTDCKCRYWLKGWDFKRWWDCVFGDGPKKCR